MKRASEIDVKAIRAEYKRTHTDTSCRTAGQGRYTRKVDTSDAEAEFGRAVDRYKRENHRPFPTYGELLAILEALGYRPSEEDPC